MIFFSRIPIENKNRSLETADTGALQDEVEKEMVWSNFDELFYFWLKLQKPYVTHFLWIGSLKSG